ncbi:MAG TPA: hypothetical protein VE591_06205 [Candidatus Acidoferrum sp.]|nr:hypothetical protein [Candidatus Acidoferrum sp.]
MKARVLTLAAALWIGGTGAALAQGVPSVPPDVQNNPIVQSILQSVGGLLQTTNGNAAHGKVTYFRRFDLQIETAPNVYRQIHLHQGTIINPRGLTLAPGMVVDVSGTAQPDHSLNADSITAH